MKFEKTTLKILKKLYEADSLMLGVEELNKIGSKQEVETVLTFLSERQLVRWDNEVRMYKLIPEGIAYLNKQVSDKNQQEFNKIVAFTGAILALTAIYNFIKEDFMYHFVNTLILKLIFLSLVVICVLPLIKSI